MILSGREAGGARGANAAKYFLIAAGNAGDALEGGRIDGVHADGDAVEAGGLSGAASLSSRWPLVVRARSSGLPERVRRRASSWSSSVRPAAQQWLAAGEADLFDSQADEELDEAQVLVDAQFRILRAYFPGAAVNAFVVAAVGDGDAEIVNDATVAIRQPGGGQSPRGMRLGKRRPSAPSRLYRFAAACMAERGCGYALRLRPQSMRGVPLRSTRPVMPKTAISVRARKK